MLDYDDMFSYKPVLKNREKIPITLFLCHKMH